MSTTYLSVDYFPLTVNFFDRDAIELAEAKYGIRVELYANFYVKYSKKDITSHGVRNNR